ncbi:TIGR02117 family protein [uncultured Tateyamaria sp.]|uniref:TIGR02117 family protein n=1 Tax=uncultured Tateyamaria sp. TaxID=455651 RepID=UPI00260FF067|nr:TIGR02117 family protein [uncultured Tateyamaria sp.]
MLRRLGAGLAGIVLLYALAAALGGLWPGRTAPPTGPKTHTVRLIHGPIHYDILLPIADARRDLGWLAAKGIALDHPGADWLVVGWGARDFYTSTGTYLDLAPRSIWRAITGDRGVMRVDLAGTVPADWPALHLTDAQYRALIAGLTDSFASGAATQPMDHPGFSEWDRFFPARGRFHLFNTCNVWVGDMLRHAGIRFGIWTPTPYAVTLSWRMFHS